jgi:acyl-CoA dehydrogenase
MSDMQPMIADSAERLFAENVSKELLEQFEAGAWSQALWRLVKASGFTLVTVPEGSGGIGGDWSDAYEILRAIGYWNVPLPLSETMLASSLLAQAGLPIPDEPMTVIEAGPGSSFAIDSSRSGKCTVDGAATAVPWASYCRWAVLSIPDGARCGVALIDLVQPAAIRIVPHQNLAKEPRDDLHFTRAAFAEYVAAASIHTAQPVRVLGALSRAAMMVGALESALDQSIRYSNDRIQFGRPIGKFQAIQQSLAVLAGEVGAARMAARVAADSVPAASTRFDIAVAKVRAGEAAGRAASIAHQVHGAIGFTYEHSLHFATRRLWSWRGEFGGASLWARELGVAAIAAGARGFWPALTERALLNLRDHE